MFWTKKWGILIKKESEPLINQGIKIPRDYRKDRRDTMEKMTLKLHVITEMMGILCVSVFLIPTIYCISKGEVGVSVLFMFFVVLGSIMILAYQKQRFILTETEIVVTYFLKKRIEIFYYEIRYVLKVDMRNQTQFLLIGNQYERLLIIDPMFVELEKAFAFLKRKGIEVIDLRLLLEEGEDITKYFPMLTQGQRNFYQSMLEMSHTVNQR